MRYVDPSQDTSKMPWAGGIRQAEEEGSTCRAWGGKEASSQNNKLRGAKVA